LEKEDLGQNIGFLGELGDYSLIKAIKSSKLLLYPSLADSLLTVILKSLACGTPVVAYDIPPVKHNFEKCDAVFRCPPKNIKKVVEAILAIIKNETRIHLLTRKAKEYSKKYTWQNVVRAEKAGYFKVIDAYNETSH